MRKPKHFANGYGRGKGDKKAWVTVSETAASTAASRSGPARGFIPPPTREQLMAGSANLRRVYKVEA